MSTQAFVRRVVAAGVLLSATVFFGGCANSQAIEADELPAQGDGDTTSADLMWEHVRHRLQQKPGIPADLTGPKRPLAQSSPIRVTPPSAKQGKPGDEVTYTIELNAPITEKNQVFLVFYSTTQHLDDADWVTDPVSQGEKSFPLKLKAKTDAADGARTQFMVFDTDLKGDAVGSLTIKK